MKKPKFRLLCCTINIVTGECFNWIGVDPPHSHILSKVSYGSYSNLIQKEYKNIYNPHDL